MDQQACNYQRTGTCIAMGEIKENIASIKVTIQYQNETLIRLEEKIDKQNNRMDRMDEKIQINTNEISRFRTIGSVLVFLISVVLAWLGIKK